MQHGARAVSVTGEAYVRLGGFNYSAVITCFRPWVFVMVISCD